MLELLPETKRKILLQYPFIRRYFLVNKRGKTSILLKIFSSIQLGKKEFLKNLELFKFQLIKEGITESELDVLKRELSHKEYDEIINSLPERERKIALELKNPEISVKIKAIMELSDLRCEASIPLIEQMLKDMSSTIRVTAIRALLGLKSKNSSCLIEQMLRDSDYMVRYTTIKALNFLSEDTKYHRYYSLLQHRLYFGQDINFFTGGERGSLGEIKRAKFKKSGETILLGGKLAGRVIVRIVSEPAFTAWKKAFEAKDAWKKAGFDYVPVEPILMKNGKLLAYKTKSGNYRVYAKVLDYSFQQYFSTLGYSEFEDELLMAYHRIISTLDGLGIVHGHLHSRNFCIEIYKGKPRLYVIDFDDAIVK